MEYPNVPWLSQAEVLLENFLTNKQEFTSLDFKNAMREKHEDQDIRQGDIGTFLRASASKDKMPNFEASQNGTFVTYKPVAVVAAPSLLDKFKSFFK